MIAASAARQDHEMLPQQANVTMAESGWSWHDGATTSAAWLELQFAASSGWCWSLLAPQALQMQPSAPISTTDA